MQYFTYYTVIPSNITTFMKKVNSGLYSDRQVVAHGNLQNSCPGCKTVNINKIFKANISIKERAILALFYFNFIVL